MVQVGSQRQQRRPRASLQRTALTVALTVVLVYAVNLLRISHVLSTSASSSTVLRTEIHDGIPPPRSAQNNNAVTVAYAVSVTGCGADPLTEGAAVLQHSIHRNSVRGTTRGGRYDYQMYAIYHPNARSCATPLADLGYTLLERNVLVSVPDIEGEYLRSKIESNGCCGEKELIKLEAYTLTQHPIVVHLDLDVLILQPLDDLFDAMLNDSTTLPRSFRQWPHETFPSTINAFYTVDYNMVKPHITHKPVQGGFLVTRPSLDTYNDFKAIVKKGDFRQSGGWGGVVGPFYGSMTFQGIIPYYYRVVQPGHAVELNRCIFNQMCDNPRTEKTVNDVVAGDCRTGEESCEDCRSRPLGDVKTVHYTLCQKPWWCVAHQEDAIQHRLCKQLVREWYLVRSELEASWGRSGQGRGEFLPQTFMGYCKSHGKQGYLPIGPPYGPNT